LIGTKLDSIKKIVNIRVPKLFIHSNDDDIVPFAYGKKLFDAAPEPKEFLEISGDHNEGFNLSANLYIQGIVRFLQKVKLI
jgi:fermentation-respiration switch protein FrsA (DUF1100 family)